MGTGWTPRVATGNNVGLVGCREYWSMWQRWGMLSRQMYFSYSDLAFCFFILPVSGHKHILPLIRDFFWGSVWSSVGDSRFIWKTNNAAGSWVHMINYCQAVGNSKRALSSNSHLSSSFMNTRPHKALRNDSCFSTKVQGGWLLENFRIECYLPFLLFGRCNWDKILTFWWEIAIRLKMFPTAFSFILHTQTIKNIGVVLFLSFSFKYSLPSSFSLWSHC